MSEEPRKLVLSDEHGETLRLVEHDRPAVDSLAYVSMFGGEGHARLSRAEVLQAAQFLVDLLGHSVRPAHPVSGHDWTREDGGHGQSTAYCASCETSMLQMPDESLEDFVRRLEENVDYGTCEEMQVRRVMES